LCIGSSIILLFRSMAWMIIAPRGTLAPVKGSVRKLDCRRQDNPRARRSLRAYRSVQPEFSTNAVYSKLSLVQRVVAPIQFGTAMSNFHPHIMRILLVICLVDSNHAGFAGSASAGCWPQGTTQ
jgi:hypothetical protein